MALFGRREEEIPAPPPMESAPSGVPVEEVRNMKQQGLSDTQVVSTLQRNGFKSHQIFDAMNQAELTPAAPVEQPPVQEYPQQYPAQQYPAYQDYAQPASYPQQSQLTNDDMDRFEEVAEAIVDEKWSELMKGVNKIIDWKESTETRINTVEQRLSDLKKSFDELNKALFSRMQQYDKSVRDVGTDVKAMQQVFKEIIPTLTENVSELSKITSDLKKR
ncbi:MAG: hypothetical protein ABIG95_01250 [Candidatus Woesearchaeota archaeon]